MSKVPAVEPEIGDSVSCYASSTGWDFGLLVSVTRDHPLVSPPPWKRQVMHDITGDSDFNLKFSAFCLTLI